VIRLIFSGGEDMKDLESQKLTWKQYLVVASLLFGLFFGAGNLIFPLHLGQLAGSNWGTATVGFLITGVLLPLLSVLAVAITRSEGVYDIGKPLGAGFAVVFMVLIHATIGPLFGTPRTATVSFTVGVAPFIPKNMQTPAFFIS
jgi:LIVCS family branched-chain amino acid:cation transporter